MSRPTLSTNKMSDTGKTVSTIRREPARMVASYRQVTPLVWIANLATIARAQLIPTLFIAAEGVAEIDPEWHLPYFQTRWVPPSARTTTPPTFSVPASSPPRQPQRLRSQQARPLWSPWTSTVRRWQGILQVDDWARQHLGQVIPSRLRAVSVSP